MRVIDLKRELEKLPDHAAIEVIEDSITITYQVQAHTEVAVDVSCPPITKERIENLQKTMYEEVEKELIEDIQKDFINAQFNTHFAKEAQRIARELGKLPEFPKGKQHIAREVTDLHKQKQDNPEEPKPFKRGDPITIEVNGVLWQGTYNQKFNEEWSEISVKMDDTNDIWQVLTKELKHAGEQP